MIFKLTINNIQENFQEESYLSNLYKTINNQNKNEKSIDFSNFICLHDILCKQEKISRSPG